MRRRPVDYSTETLQRAWDNRWLIFKMMQPVLNMFPWIDRDDMFGPGFDGLCEGYDTVENSRASKTTYICMKIRNSMMNYAMERGRTVRIPDYAHKVSNMVRDGEIDLESCSGEDRATYLAARAVKDITDIGGIDVASEDPDPGEQDDYSDAARALLDPLNEKQRSILSLWFGLGTEHPHSQQEIADRLGSTKDAVHVNKKRALAKLRAHFAHHSFRSLSDVRDSIVRSQ